MSDSNFSRRQFLRGAGDFLLTLPFLPSLLPRSAWAAADNFTLPPFLVFFKSDLGISKYSNYFPTVDVGARRNFTHVNSLGNYTAYEADLPVTLNRISPVFGTPFATQTQNLILLEGLDYDTNTGHNVSFGWGNYGSGSDAGSTPDEVRSQTIDSYLAGLPTFNKNVIRLSPGAWKSPTSSYRPGGVQTIELTANDNNGIDKNTGKKVYYGAPRLFQALFGGNSGFGTADTSTSETRSVIDKVIEDYRRVQKKLGKADAQVFEEHISEINDLDKAIRAGGSTGGGGSVVTAATCDVKSFTQAGVANSTAADALQQTWENHLKIVSRAIKCGLTQLVMINVKSGLSTHSRSGSSDIFYEDTGGDTKIHQASHNAVYAATSGIDSGLEDSENFAYDRLLGAFQWTAEKVFLKAFQELDTKGANGVSFMNNGMVVWTQENSRAHDTAHIPLAVLTRRPDVPGNRIIDYTHYESPRQDHGGDRYITLNGVKTLANTHKETIPGTSYRRFLVSLVDSLGFKGSDMPTQGTNSVANPYNAKVLDKSGNTIRYTRCNETLPDSFFRSPLPMFKKV